MKYQEDWDDANWGLLGEETTASKDKTYFDWTGGSFYQPLFLCCQHHQHLVTTNAASLASHIIVSGTLTPMCGFETPVVCAYIWVL